MSSTAAVCEGLVRVDLLLSAVGLCWIVSFLYTIGGVVSVFRENFEYAGGFKAWSVILVLVGFIPNIITMLLAIILASDRRPERESFRVTAAGSAAMSGFGMLYVLLNQPFP